MPKRAKILLRNRNSVSEYPILGWGGPAVGCWIKNDIPSNVYTLLGFQIAFRIFPSRPPLCWDAKKDENLTPKPKFGFGVTHFWVYLRSGWSIWKMTLGAWLWVGWNQYMSNWRRSENWRSDTLNLIHNTISHNFTGLLDIFLYGKCTVGSNFIFRKNMRAEFLQGAEILELPYHV